MLYAAASLIFPQLQQSYGLTATSVSATYMLENLPAYVQGSHRNHATLELLHHLTQRAWTTNRDGGKGHPAFLPRPRAIRRHWSSIFFFNSLSHVFLLERYRQLSRRPPALTPLPDVCDKPALPYLSVCSCRPLRHTLSACLLHEMHCNVSGALWCQYSPPRRARRVSNVQARACCGPARRALRRTRCVVLFPVER